MVACVFIVVDIDVDVDDVVVVDADVVDVGVHVNADANKPDLSDPSAHVTNELFIENRMCCATITLTINFKANGHRGADEFLIITGISDIRMKAEKRKEKRNTEKSLIPCSIGIATTMCYKIRLE